MDKNKNNYIDILEFIDGMTTMFYENYEKLIKFIFNFYDFQNKGKISKEDVKVVLSYIPLKIRKYSSKKLKFEKEEYRDRVESQDELFFLVENCFSNKNELTEKEFFDVIENISSDMFLFILIFLYEKKPFSELTLKEYEGRELHSALMQFRRTPVLTSKYVASPNLHSKFSPSKIIRRSPMMTKRNLLEDSEIKNSCFDVFSVNSTFTLGNINERNLKNPQNKNDSKNLLMKFAQKSNNRNSSNSKASKFNNENSNSKQISNFSIKKNIENREIKSKSKEKEKEIKISNNDNQIINNNSDFDNDNLIDDAENTEENINAVRVPVHKKKRNDLYNLGLLGTKLYKKFNISDKSLRGLIDSFSNNNINMNEELRKEDEINKKNIISKKENNIDYSNDNNIKENNSSSDEELESNKIITNEGFLFKITHSNKMKKLWFKLVQKDLYYYKNKGDLTHRGMHNLSGTYITEEAKLKHENEEYFCIGIIYPKKTRKYYIKDKSEYLKWLKYFHIITEYSTITEIYEISVRINFRNFYKKILLNSFSNIHFLNIFSECSRKRKIRINKTRRS